MSADGVVNLRPNGRKMRNAIFIAVLELISDALVNAYPPVGNWLVAPLESALLKLMH